jgi:hypothetical protein
VPEVEYVPLTRDLVVELPAQINRDVDILLVIDDSGSMADKQNSLANSFPNFVNQLAQIEGGLPNVHIGVTSTDMGTKTSGSPTPAPTIGVVGQGGCADRGKNGIMTVNGANVTGAFVSDIKLPDGTRQTNYTGTLADVVGTMVRLGATGCGFEQPLAAMKAALANNPNNAGFLRPDALLAVLFLADEDDCSIKSTQLLNPGDTQLGALSSFRCTRFGVICESGGATPNEMNQVGVKADCHANVSSPLGLPLMDEVEPYHAFLTGLKADPRRVVVGGITGDTTPFAVELRTINGTTEPALAHSCMFAVGGADQFADPATRLSSFFDLFPDRAASASICNQDLSNGFAKLGELISRGIGTPCVTANLRDVDPNTGGVQEDCIVEDVVGTSRTTIERCGSGTCWRLVADPVLCPLGANLKLAVERESAPPNGTVTQMRCQLD